MQKVVLPQRFFSLADLLILMMIGTVIYGLVTTGQQWRASYHPVTEIDLSIRYLPYYTILSGIRGLIAYALSLTFTIFVGYFAAKSATAEKILIPMLDILQSIPVLAFLPVVFLSLISIFPKSNMGLELGAILLIFTGQVWNMTFGFYQSLKTLPHDLIEVSAVFRLSAWQRFWKVEVPFSMSSLLWNMMISMSASWFFVVLSEAIVVAHQDIRLPGVGSYIALAIAQKDLHAVGFAIMTMVIVIFLYDQILFRPLVAWSEKFKMEQSPDETEYQSWLIDLLRGSQLIKRIGRYFSLLKEYFVNAQLFCKKGSSRDSD